MNIFKPSPRYLTRLRVVISLWAVVFLVLGILSAWLVSLDVQNTGQATRVVQAVIITDLIWYLPALKIVQSSFNARVYQFDEDEITIHSGWWTESVRHIPLSSVVAFETRWDRLDRWLEIGTLEIYIVSRHHVNGSHVRMTGLADVEMVTQLANRLLKHMREQRLTEKVFSGGLANHSLLSNRQ
jgi:membrane protein YdbS with pleckstrin-like domain